MAKHVVCMLALCATVSVTLGEDDGCTSIGGHCQEDSLACSGGYTSGLCSGTATRRCCAPAGEDDGCTSIGGHCQEDSLACSGGYTSGLCSGSATRRCCAPAGSGGCSNVNIISRSQWGASAATSHTTMTVPVHEFFIHHTETGLCHDVSSCSTIVKSIQNYHMGNNGWADIGYSFLVGGDGNVYEGRGWSWIGAHTEGYNSKAFAASMIGSFMTSLPTDQALAAVKNLIDCGIQHGKIASDYRLYGHRDAGQTDCPGDALYAEIQNWPHYSHTHP